MCTDAQMLLFHWRSLSSQNMILRFSSWSSSANTAILFIYQLMGFRWTRFCILLCDVGFGLFCTFTSSQIRIIVWCSVVVVDLVLIFALLFLCRIRALSAAPASSSEHQHHEHRTKKRAFTEHIWRMWYFEDRSWIFCFIFLCRAIYTL